MSTWTAGYVSDIDYTYGYYNELNPLRAELGLLNSSLQSPKFETACELGFGQGLSANYHAAASTTEWYGTDFNPAQAGFAQELAKVAGSGAKLFDEAFAEFSNRKDLPDFDFIGLHGIWSWISDENRVSIVDFLRRKLKVGGVLYISYNTLPGWAGFAPMRHLMTEHADIIGSEGQGIASRIDGALEFANKLLDTNPRYSMINTQVSARLKEMSEKDRNYLAHEYFNKNWDPMYFASLAQWLEPTKVDFAGSAHYSDLFDSVNLNEDQQTFMNGIPDSLLKQSVRDFVVDQGFRRDYWVKGARRISPLERYEKFQDKQFMLVQNRSNILLEIEQSHGKSTMNADIYNPILDLIAEHKALSIRSLQRELTAKNIEFPLIVEAMLILTSKGSVAPVQNESNSNGIKKQVDRVNDYVIDKARSGKEIGYLASPVTGGGIGVNRFDQLFVGAIKEGKKSAEELAKTVWTVLAMQGQSLVVEGKALETDEENLAELTKKARIFNDKSIPILKALKIV